MISTGEKKFYIQCYVCSPDIAIIWHTSEDEDAFQFVIDPDLINDTKKTPLLTTDKQLEVDDFDFTSSIYP